MDSSSGSTRKPALCFQFRAFEVNLGSQELRKNGVLIRVPPQPFQVLVMLLERAGELVTREEIQHELWGDDVSVEFDAGLNRCIRQLRAALADDADAPRYIETVSRKGYRFIAAVNQTRATARSSSVAVREGTPLKILEPSPPTDSSLRSTETPVGRRAFSFWIPVAIAAAIIVAFAVLVKWPRVDVSKSHFNLDAVPLANAPGDQYSPSFSPDGREVTFTWNGEAQGSFHIYRKLLNSPNALRLTSGAKIDYSPVWSPDGHWIAFCRGGQQPGGAVWLIPPLGGSERKLVDLDAVAWPVNQVLAWSADSKWLVISERLAHSRDRGLSLVNVQSGTTSQLTRPGAGQDDTSPTVSPGGETVAFTRDSGHGVSSIQMIPFAPYAAPPKQIRQMAWHGFENVRSASATWTPDGKQIVFESNKGGRQHLFAAFANGAGDPVDLAALGDNVSSPEISTQGQLAYVHELENVNIWKINTHSTNAAEAPVRLIASTRISKTPAVSPDGTRIAFASNQYGNSEIWTSKIDGTDLMQLTSLKNPGTGSPAWSPDGSQIVFDARIDGQPRLYVISSEGGLPRKITTAGNGVVPAWSPDSKWIYYSSDSSGRSEIWRISPSGGTAEQVTSDGGFAPVLSPDGKYLYYTETRTPFSSLWQFSLANRQKKLIAPAVIRRAYAAATDGLYFVSGPVFGPQELYFLNGRAAKPSFLLKLENRIEDSMSLASDGRALYLAQIEHRSYDLMIAENFWRK